MNKTTYSHPGYLYKLTRTDDDITSTLQRVSGLKTKNQELHIFLTPPGASSSTVSPFNNCRFKSIIEEADVVVFDTRSEDEPRDPINNLCKVLRENYTKETLLRMNDALTESLKGRNVDMAPIDQKIGEDFDKLASSLAAKILLLMRMNLEARTTTSCTSTLSSSSSSEAIPLPVSSPTEKLAPKQRILRYAQEAGKSIEYIDERNAIEKHGKLLFEQGFLEFFFCSILTDLELLQSIMSASRKEIEDWNSCTLDNGDDCKLKEHPKLFERAQRFDITQDGLDEIFTLAKKINDALLSEKKTLVILEKGPEIIQELKRFIPVYSESDVEIKGPIREPTGCFWKIKQQGMTVGYLLGSIHKTPNYLLHLNSCIRKCFEKSNRIAVEIDCTRLDIQEENRRQCQKQRAEKYSALTSEQIHHISMTLKKIFPNEAEKTDFNNEEEKRDFIFNGIVELKSKIYTKLDIFSGIDFQLIQQAKAFGKPVEDLETLEQYAQQESTQEMLAKDAKEDFFLRCLSLEAIIQYDDIDEVITFIIKQVSLHINETLEPMFNAWETGNLEELDLHKKDDSTNKRMVRTQRNMNMAMRIVSMINAKEKIFCCVGAAHTTGEMSVQAFLHNFGLSTERVFV